MTFVITLHVSAIFMFFHAGLAFLYCNRLSFPEVEGVTFLFAALSFMWANASPFLVPLSHGKVHFTLMPMYAGPYEPLVSREESGTSGTYFL
jgi:hypothetical protein